MSISLNGAVLKDILLEIYNCLHSTQLTKLILLVSGSIISGNYEEIQ